MSTSANQPGQPGGAEAHLTLNLDPPASALAVGAHPDDVEFGCGGTLAKWAAAGTVIHHLVCTDGSKGTWDPDADIDALRATREDEQRRAARILGRERSGEVRFIRRVDGELVNDEATRREVVRAIRELRPDVLLGHDPWKRYRLHPDHRAAGWLLCDAVVAARDPHFMRGVGPGHHRPAAILLWEAQDVNHVEDIGAHLDTKLAALAAHRSQYESTMGVLDDAELADFDERLRRRHAELGAPHDLAAAEWFARIDDL